MPAFAVTPHVLGYFHDPGAQRRHEFRREIGLLQFVYLAGAQKLDMPLKRLL